MELKIKQGDGEATFLITEIVNGVASETGQHTEESVLNTISALQGQISELQQYSDKMNEYLLKIQSFKAEQLNESEK